ncbi:phosphoenolpyruvate carboxylase, partial [Candidatus Margulisiibacteriota bacterium]
EWHKKELKMADMHIPLEIIPELNNYEDFFNAKKYLEDLTTKMRKKLKMKIKTIRLAINLKNCMEESGWITGMIAAKTALAECMQYEDKKGIPVIPIIYGGGEHIKGNISPLTNEKTHSRYQGVKTLGIDSQYLNNYPIDEIKKGLQNNSSLTKKNNFETMNKQDKHRYWEIAKVNAKWYIEMMEEFQPFIDQFNNQCEKPSLTTKSISPVNILYSVGFPPEIIGLGRTLKQLYKKRLLKKFEEYVPLFKYDLVEIGNFCNLENIKTIIKKYKLFEIEDDIVLTEDYIDQKLQPGDKNGIQHRNKTSDILIKFLKGDTITRKDLHSAAVLRKW